MVFVIKNIIVHVFCQITCIVIVYSVVFDKSWPFSWTFLKLTYVLHKDKCQICNFFIVQQMCQFLSIITLMLQKLGIYAAGHITYININIPQFRNHPFRGKIFTQWSGRRNIFYDYTISHCVWNNTKSSGFLHSSGLTKSTKYKEYSICYVPMWLMTQKVGILIFQSLFLLWILAYRTFAIFAPIWMLNFLSLLTLLTTLRIPKSE